MSLCMLRRPFSTTCTVHYDWSRHPSVNMNCKVIEGEASKSKPIIIVHGMLGSSTNWMSLARQGAFGPVSFIYYGFVNLIASLGIHWGSIMQNNRL